MNFIVFLLRNYKIIIIKYKIKITQIIKMMDDAPLLCTTILFCIPSVLARATHVYKFQIRIIISNI